jgi:MFS family permease
MIGVVVLAMALAEGAATDWLPLVMVDGHGMSAALGSFVFAAVAMAMTVGRFGGGWFLDRYGRASVLRSSACAAVVGIGCIALVDDRLVASAGVLLWGLGLSLGFPVAVSAAGDTSEGAAARVSFVTTMGYLAFLVGPPALGVIGEDFGLRVALLVPLGLVLVAVFLAPALAPEPGLDPVFDPVLDPVLDPGRASGSSL